MLSYAPIAIFGFNRPYHFSRMLESLSRCTGFQESPIHIFLDGPRHIGEKDVTAAVLQIAKQIKHPNCCIQISNENRGLRRSISAGVSEVLERYGRAVVFEDDFLFSPVILDYFALALEKYADDPNVMSIGAYMPSVPEFENVETSLLLPYAHPWGWATWESAWSGFHPSAENVSRDLIHSRSFKQRLNVYGLRDFHEMLNMALIGKVDSWYSYWHYFIASRNGLSVFPPKSYVKNVGLDGSGTHASIMNPLRFLVDQPEISHKLCRLEESTKINYRALDLIRLSKECVNQRRVDRLGNFKRKVLMRSSPSSYSID